MLSRLGPNGPFPAVGMHEILDRRWLHYAFRAPDAGLSIVANLSTLGDSARGVREPQRMSILLVHDGDRWESTQFNARVEGTPWSAFRLPDPGPALRLRAPGDGPALDLSLRRTGRPCTSQCAPFAVDQHLRWQSEPGVVAGGTVTVQGRAHKDVILLGYHERVRGHWGWPLLGGWVFGFANAPATNTRTPPPYAVVFTLIQPTSPPGAATASVMLWREGRLLRHFPRRRIEVAVAGLLPRDRVHVCPPLAQTLGAAPAAAVPAHLLISASTAADELELDFRSTTAARIVNPNELGTAPFSVHEVLGPCRVTGVVCGREIDFTAPAVVEFAGGADVD